MPFIIFSGETQVACGHIDTCAGRSVLFFGGGVSIYIYVSWEPAHTRYIRADTRLYVCGT